MQNCIQLEFLFDFLVKSCLKVHATLLAAMKKRRFPILGGHSLPSCNKDGTWAPQQCRGSTGYCWCVTPQGRKIRGTSRGPGHKKVNCASKIQYIFLQE